MTALESANAPRNFLINIRTYEVRLVFRCPLLLNRCPESNTVTEILVSALHHSCVRSTRLLLISAMLLCLAHWFSGAQQTAQADSDSDGLSDDLEQSLLVQFAPTFMVGAKDCANTPGEFRPGVNQPLPRAENGTIYGQVFPSKTSAGETPVVEIHYYHLWKRDCGAHGHPLDAEHVSTLVRASGSDFETAHWKALYWYAAAHEGTVCDVRQITRASALHAEDRGAEVWISPGKHASYLSEAMCQGGCGADRCQDMVSLPAGKLINLGEPRHPMNGSLFISSSLWPLASKMATTNFPESGIARLDQLAASDIALFDPGRHPVQGVIAISSTTGDAIATGGSDTNGAISLAEESTGNALQNSYRKTKHALGISGQHVGEALHVIPKPDAPE